MNFNQRLKTAVRAYPALTLWIVGAPAIFILFFLISKVS